VSVNQLNQLQLGPQQVARGANMENMKSISFDHWGHRGQPLEAKVSKTKSIIDDLNFHVFKSRGSAPATPKAACRAIMENMKSIIFGHWGHRG
jgi:hypothetical protein